MQVLVTGVAGMIGDAVVRRLRGSGREVVAVDVMDGVRAYAKHLAGSEI